jgi:P27 family predicted phage terminase small subunit
MSKARLPKAPDQLGPEARKEWARITKAPADAGELDERNFATLTAYCASYGRLLEAEAVLSQRRARYPHAGLLQHGRDGKIRVSPAVRIAEQAAREVLRYAKALALMPSLTERGRLRRSALGRKVLAEKAAAVAGAGTPWANLLTRSSDRH